MRKRFPRLAASFLISYVVMLLIPMLMSLRPITSAQLDLRGKVEELNYLALSQAAGDTESVFESALGSMFRLSQSENIRKLFYVEQPLNSVNRTDIYMALQSDIKQARADAPIGYECAVYFINGRFMISQTARYTPQVAYEQLFSASGYSYDEIMHLLTTCHRQEILDMGSSLMLIHSYPYTGQTAAANMIAIIPKSNIYSKIEESSWIDNGSFRAYGSDGALLLSGGAADDDAGSIRTKIGGKWFKEYSLSVPESLAFGEIGRNMRISYTVYFGGALMLGVLIALIFSYRRYKPIKRIVHAIDNTDELPADKPQGELEHIYTSVNRMITGNAEMKKQLEIRTEYMRRDFLSKLLRGRLEFTEVDAERLNRYSIEFPYDCFMIFLASHTENSAADLSATFMIADILGRSRVAYACETNEYSAWIVNLADPSDEEEVINEFRAAFAEAAQVFSIAPSAACSGVHTSYAGIHNGYEEAHYAIDLTKDGEFTCYTPPDDKQYGYTPDMEQALLRALKMDDRVETARVLSEIFNKSKGCALHELKLMLFNMETSLMTLLEGIGEETGKHDALKSANEIDRLNSLKGIFAYAEQLADSIMLMRRQHFEQHGNRLIEGIRSYVENHISDSALSNTAISDAMNISASYLSRVFKQETGENLLDYINRIRIDRACALLKTQPGMQLKDVCENVGYCNMTTFTRMFKKYAGVTPGKYTAADGV